MGGHKTAVVNGATGIDGGASHENISDSNDRAPADLRPGVYRIHERKAWGDAENLGRNAGARPIVSDGHKSSPDVVAAHNLRQVGDASEDIVVQIGWAGTLETVDQACNPIPSVCFNRLGDEFGVSGGAHENEVHSYQFRM